MDEGVSLHHDYYDIFERRRKDSIGGGIAVLIDKNLKAFDYTHKDTEHVLCLKILGDGTHKGGHIFLLTTYFPPKNKENALKDLEEAIEYVKKKYKNPSLLILGDFNLEEKGHEI